MRGQALKGHLDLLLLAVLEGREAHGYMILELLRVASGGEFDLPEGTVYPALHRLEAAGQVESSWTEHAGRKRKVYRLTSHGRAGLAAQRQEWSTFAAAVARTVKGPTWLTT